MERWLHVGTTKARLVMVMRTYELVRLYFLFYYEVIFVVLLFLVLVGLGVMKVVERVYLVRRTSENAF